MILISIFAVEAQIHDRLKEVMQTVDLDDVTSKDIRMKVHIFVDFFERCMKPILRNL